MCKVVSLFPHVAIVKNGNHKPVQKKEKCAVLSINICITKTTNTEPIRG